MMKDVPVNNAVLNQNSLFQESVNFPSLLYFLPSPPLLNLGLTSHESLWFYSWVELAFFFFSVTALPTDERNKKEFD